MLTDTVSATPAAPATVTRRRSSKYPPTTREALTALLAHFNRP